MISRKVIRKNIKQISALTEKNLKLRTRFKSKFIISFITPVITIMMPLIVMGKFFDLNADFGPWTAQTYYVYLFIAYKIYLLRQIISEYPSHLLSEKYWKTFAILIISPFNRFNLLISILISNFIILIVPFTIFMIIAYIIYPISFITVLFVILIYIIIAFLFSSIGLLIGIFAVSKENVWRILGFMINLIFWASCLVYPFEIFPKLIQDIIRLNPLYYIFDFLRFAWVEDDVIFTIMSHSFQFIILISTTILLSFIGIYTFNKVYRKYGIVGY